jgi:hypothetical protein
MSCFTHTSGMFSGRNAIPAGVSETRQEDRIMAALGQTIDRSVPEAADRNVSIGLRQLRYEISVVR